MEQNYRAIIKIGEKRWASIGNAKGKNDKISVELEQTPIPANGKMRFLLVPKTVRSAGSD